MRAVRTITLVAAMLGAAPAVAQIYLSEREVQELTARTPVLGGELDGVLAGERVRVTINGPSDLTYAFLGMGEAYDVTDPIARAGGRPDGNPTMNFTQPDGRDVRFEWLDGRTIRFEFWYPGNKAGRIRNNPADAKTLLTPVAAGATEVPRTDATALVAPGRYVWTSERGEPTALTVREDGSFRDEYGPGSESSDEGDLVVDGEEMCFDVVSGTCFRVEGPSAEGVYTLTTTAKFMQPQDGITKNVHAGDVSTLTPE